MQYNHLVAKSQQKLNLQALYSWLLALIILWLPLNLFYVLQRQNAYVHGLLVDYLLPRLYLSDIPLLLLLFLSCLEAQINKIKGFFANLYTKRNLLVGLLLAILLIVRQFFTPKTTAALWYSFKLLEIAWFFYFLNNHQQLLKKLVVKLALWLSLLIQALLGLYQYFSQANLLPYHLLGETNFSRSIGLAKDIWWQTGRILPYGSTAHPNILGGFLVVFWLILYLQQREQFKTGQFHWLKSLFWLVITLLVGLTLVLTQSISAILSLIIGLFVLHCLSTPHQRQHWAKYFFLAWLTLPFLLQLGAQFFPALPSISRRALFNSAALKMIYVNPWWGTGLNQFTYYLENFSQRTELMRFVQPAHHLGLLWLAETGLLGLLVLIWLFKSLKKNNSKFVVPLMILMPIAALDHYLLTQQSGLLLLVISLIFLSNKTVNIKKSAA